MNKIIEAGDILAGARHCVECIFLAAGSLSREAADPVQVVADIASTKIGEAIALLEEYRESKDSAGPAPAPDTKPKSRPTRHVANRRGK
jgi:hypothetical protein